MDILNDNLRREAEFATAVLARLGPRKDGIEMIISLPRSAASRRMRTPEEGTLAKARLLLDVAGGIEQAFVSTLRAQPRLGWASMRMAAEACKDLECLRRNPELISFWLAASNAQDLEEYKKAQSVFVSERRRSVTEDGVIQTCKTTMTLCNILGSHPNATALGTMGPVKLDKEEQVVTIAPRVTDPATLDWHLRSMMTHGMSTAMSVAWVTAQSLDDEDRMALEGLSKALYQAVAPLLGHSNGDR